VELCTGKEGAKKGKIITAKGGIITAMSKKIKNIRI